MGQSLVKNYIHIVFSTKNHHRFITAEIADELYAYIGGICNKLECLPVKVGGYEDHIHILCLLSKKITIVKLLEEVKSSSSKWIKTKGFQYSDFYWQDGYGVFSVNPTEIDLVVEYISNQKEKHKKVSFRDEMIAFLKKYKIDYDERYV